MTEAERVTGNVVDFPKKPRRRDTDVVLALREILALAERGEIRGMVVGAVPKEADKFLIGMAGCCKDHLGTARRVADCLLRHVSLAIGARRQGPPDTDLE